MKVGKKNFLPEDGKIKSQGFFQNNRALILETHDL